jgi:serine protease Do
MIKKLSSAVLAALCGAMIYAVAENTPPTQLPTLPKVKDSDPLPSGLFVNLYKTVNPAVVNIFTTYVPREQRIFRDPGRDPFFDLFDQFMGPSPYGQAMPQQSLGTGFIIREDGLIVTNNHVVDRADIIKVQIEENNKQSFDAKVIGKDAKTDIALIKIDAKRKLPFLKMGSSTDTQVGEWVAAFGNPYGYGHTMTKGIISAVGREIDELNMFPFMQTDASINPGNSGGPLVNTQGLVIGVNAAIDARANGIGFVIPIDNVKTILPQLEKNGSISRGFMGVQLEDIDDEQAQSLGVKSSEGAFVMRVIPGHSAEKAGLQPYDLITEFDSKKIASSKELTKQAAITPVGKKLPLKVIRNGKEMKLTLTMGSTDELKVASTAKSPKLKKIEGLKAPYSLGFVAADYTSVMSQEFNLPKLSRPRPVILAIEPDSEAARSGLSPGDVILDVNRREVSHTKEAFKHLRRGTINILRILKNDRVVLVSLRAS